ncbi:MAG: HRDC domain-containing protein [Vicingaceae bacterium]|nr:MAG: HRDC domain-containing protein [Vicingaceae bacterium]WKZ76279.1 MAG: HRDC domain-containing protein [Vicingaceae bacterium]
MKVKVFHIRLTKDNLQTDQDNLNNFLDSVTVKKTATELISGQPNFWSILVFYDDQKTEKQVKTSDKISVTADTELTEGEKRIFEILKQWRQDKATQLNIPNFMVCHNTELMTIAKVKPQTLDDLSQIKGFGGQKIAKFGDDIIALLNSI